MVPVLTSALDTGGQAYQRNKAAQLAAIAELDAQLELEADIQQEMAGTQDFVEGVTAFVTKRPAAFGGA